MVALGDLRRTPEWQASNPQVMDDFIRQAVEAELAFANEPGREAGRRRQLEARRGHDTFDRLSAITAPTLICAGRHDGIALPEAQEAMAARIPNAELRFFEGGHLFVMQDKSAYPAIIDWLKRP
jgi:3-oxoadipate enol-lactonase